MLSDVRLFLAKEGYDIPPSELQEAVNESPLMEQRLRDIILKHGYDNHRVERSLAQRELLRDSSTNGVAIPNLLKEVVVEDLKFRHTLKVDDKPTPIQPLETFYVGKGGMIPASLTIESRL